MVFSKFVRRIGFLAGLALISSAASAGGYNAYLAWVLPNGEIKLVDYNHNRYSYAWAALNEPLAAFLQNVAVSSQDSLMRIELIRDTDLSQMCGAVAYVGYGTTLNEAVGSGRYREIYRVNC